MARVGKWHVAAALNGTVPRRLSGADDEVFTGGFDDFAGDGGETVDGQDPLDLREEATYEPEVAAGDARDSGDGFGVGEVLGVEGETSMGTRSVIGSAQSAVLSSAALTAATTTSSIVSAGVGLESCSR